MTVGTLFDTDARVDNVTDWSLAQFRNHYRDEAISKDAIWEYIYGVMHAPDWRERYASDLKRQLPRVPFAPDFEAFRSAGRELMDLHLDYESCPEQESVDCLVDGMPDAGMAEPDAYRIRDRMRWASKTDHSILHINDRCRLVEIPEAAHQYQVSGRSPLEWAVDSLQRKVNKQSGIIDDPNPWHVWANHPFELIRHLRRLAYVGLRSTDVIAALPPSLEAT